jgi:hypothetical protein
MKRIVLGAVLGLLASSAAAQQNPFKLPKNNTSVAVEYRYTGDMQGTGQRAVSHDRVMEHRSTTGKFFGKTSTTDTWTLITPDSSYSADLTKKTGVAAPNVLPHMAKAYDDLDGASKQRLHQNMQDMVQMISQAFGTQAMWSDEKVGTKTYAGEKCDERTFGSFSICSMQSAPAVPLHVSGSLMCVNYEETATAVKKGDPPASDFAPPAGITFGKDTNLASPDSMARGFVKYLASQELADYWAGPVRPQSDTRIEVVIEKYAGLSTAQLRRRDCVVHPSARPSCVKILRMPVAGSVRRTGWARAGQCDSALKMDID